MRYRNAISYAILLVIACNIKDIAHVIKKISYEISLRYRNDAISHAISHLTRIQMAGALAPIQTRRRPSLVINGPPLVQPLGEIKRLHVTCLAKRATPLEAEIAHSAGGPCNREANCRTFLGLEQGISHATSHVTSYTTSHSDIAYDKAYDIA